MGWIHSAHGTPHLKVNLALLGLGIDSSLVVPTAANYRPTCWPPPRDFPIVIDAEGRVVSRYGDTHWRLWPWALKPLTLTFGDGPQRAGAAVNTPANADLLRIVVAWWLYGPKAVRNASALRTRYRVIRPLFDLCSREGIAASDLTRFPAVAEKLPLVQPPSKPVLLVNLLHALYEFRDQLGFVLLDPRGIARLDAALPDHEKRQTPCMPPRIWTHVMNRADAFLDDFHAHRDGIEKCFRFCAFGQYDGASSNGDTCISHIGEAQARRKVQRGRGGSESFPDTASRFGISGLLERWCLAQHSRPSRREIGIRHLTCYFSMVNYFGITYLLGSSLMRIEEGMSLRSDCLELERDERHGTFHMLKGTTTKTVQDPEARWITSPFAERAVSAMSCISRLRMAIAEADPSVPTEAEYVSNPFLFCRTYEPWGRPIGRRSPMNVRPRCLSLSQVASAYWRMFDTDTLRITEEDLHFARLVTPTLSASSFDVGKVWPLAWHQLRRTGAVYMQASGLVSPQSLQYQLKHETRACSLYYGQGHSRVRLNESARKEYVGAMYEVLGLQVAQLFSDRFVSPHGQSRKDDILKPVSSADSKRLAAAARDGKVSWRETLLGGCTKIGPCEYGGVDNIVRCGGGDGKAPCIDALYDRERGPAILELRKTIECRLLDASDPSPYRDSLQSQLRATDTALNVISN